VVVNLTYYCVDHLKILKWCILFGKDFFCRVCMTDKVKLLSWNWFLSKNYGSPIPFTSGVSTILYAETGRVCLGIMLHLGESRILETLLLFCPACGWSLPFFSLGYFSSRGGVFKGFLFVDGVPPCSLVIFFCFFLVLL
jgi:hypothetical protein